MSIDNVNIIDGIGTDKEGKVRCLLLTDHFPWEADASLSEYDHLVLLQEKINAYISYLELKQYPNEAFNMAVIEIHLYFAAFL